MRFIPRGVHANQAVEAAGCISEHTRFDDQHDGGAISEFRRRLADTVRAVTGEPFEIFQDVDGIGLGEHWPGKMDRLLDEVPFFIPILTPSYFQSKACRDELQRFLKREGERARRSRPPNLLHALPSHGRSHAPVE